MLVENTYDLYGKVTEKKLADGEGIRYIYNLKGKPVIAETKDGIREEYAYDALGNLKASATKKLRNIQNFSANIFKMFSFVSRNFGKYIKFSEWFGIMWKSWFCGKSN